MPKYSIIIPVYNRPNEIYELLDSLTCQTFKDFEVLVVEDGSNITCYDQVAKFESRLDSKYFFKENSGQGFSKNYGFKKANGKWLIVFDSDCIIPPHYMEIVDTYLSTHRVDAYGGPDCAHDERFTPWQKAISYAMTSLLTTGGIRGNKKHIGTFCPRSFNMGISKEVFKKTGGYLLPNKGEDIEFSSRILDLGFKVTLIEDAYVWHKRRTNFKQFFKQLHSFGTTRIIMFRSLKRGLKIVHFLPFIFVIGLATNIALLSLAPLLGKIGILVYAFYFFLVLVDSSIRTKSTTVALLSLITVFTQFLAYGIGFIQEGLTLLIKTRTHYFI